MGNFLRIKVRCKIDIYFESHDKPANCKLEIFSKNDFEKIKLTKKILFQIVSQNLILFTIVI